MKILSWNVNSVRLRMRALARILEAHRPDVVCLQETKVQDGEFPFDRFRKLGFPHQALAGQKSYNGVAVLSRVPMTDVLVRDWCRRRDCRHVQVTLEGVIELHNVYAPAGGELPDPHRNPKFAHKLRFYRELSRWFASRRGEENRLVLVGDLNVAPLPEDVWSHEKLKRVVTHTEVEVKAVGRLAASLDWVDALRHFLPAPRKLFTWWSYRAPDFRTVNRGRRLDHAWVSPALRDSLAGARVLENVRGWKLPSDHAPVLLTLDE
ncbi:MAG TPA: exodeoxyribonuclease III [Vicinamibacteria bacterium]|jgi:exodeoxyribonuclease-3